MSHSIELFYLKLLSKTEKNNNENKNCLESRSDGVRCYVSMCVCVCVHTSDTFS